MRHIHINVDYIVGCRLHCNQNLDFALAIRTMLIDDTTVKVEAGCGVVYDSVPEKN